MLVLRCQLDVGLFEFQQNFLDLVLVEIGKSAEDRFQESVSQLLHLTDLLELRIGAVLLMVRLEVFMRLLQEVADRRYGNRRVLASA